MASALFYLWGLSLFLFVIGATDAALILFVLGIMTIVFTARAKLLEGSMEELEKAEPEVDPSVADDWAREIGKKAGDEARGGFDQGYVYSSKGIWGRIGQGSKNVIEGFFKFFK